MSFLNASVSGRNGISVEYTPATPHDLLGEIPASVAVNLEGASGYLCLSIEDARSLLAGLPGVLAEHDTAQTSPAVVPADESAVA